MISAEGDVEILRGERRLLADRLRYDQDTDQIEALGNITLVEPGGEVLYADRIVLSGDLQQRRRRAAARPPDRQLAARGGRGAADRRHAHRDGPGGLLALPVLRGLRRRRRSGRSPRDAGRSTTRRPTTSPISNAFLELFGVPIAYTPYFSHPDPTVERRSGFLPPSFGSDSNLGLLLQTPYYFDLAPNYDLTVAPIFTTQENAVLTADYRHLLPSGRFDLGGSSTYATEAGSDSDPDPTGQAFRGHLEGEGDFHLDHHWGWGYDLAVTSDDTYLRPLQLQRRRTSCRTACSPSGSGSRNYAVVNGYGFQGLREDDDQGRSRSPCRWPSSS